MAFERYAQQNCLQATHARNTYPPNRSRWATNRSSRRLNRSVSNPYLITGQRSKGMAGSRILR